MPITDVTSDPERLTLTITGEYAVPVERLWEAWADPRQLERFWGPPEWPATFTRHDLVAGGRSEYRMTGPDGERAGGYWSIGSVDPGRGFDVVDGFLDESGQPVDDLPTTSATFRFEPIEGGSRFVATTTFADVESMERLAAMGMVEGATSALAQMDDVVADLRALAAGDGTELTVLDEVTLRVSRVVRGGVGDVWRAHNEPDLVRRWMLGPDGWTMPVCELAGSVGDAYRWEWASADGEERFGFEGELLERMPPRREVRTQRPIGDDGPGVREELTLTPVGDRTLLTIVMVCPSTAVRDEITATGMVDGMEASYARLEDVFAAGG